MRSLIDIRWRDADRAMMRYLIIAALLTGCGGSVNGQGTPAEAGPVTPDSSSEDAAGERTVGSAEAAPEMGREAGVDVEGGDSAACLSGLTRCVGVLLQSCTGGAWRDVAVCTFVCTEGVCSGMCAPGSTRCLDDGRAQICDDRGLWVEQANSGCGVPEAGGNACAPGQIACSGNQPTLCNAQGIFVNAGPACDFGCVGAGICTDCVPGSRRCSGRTTQECVATSAWRDTAICAFVCLNGDCVGTCTPGDQRCTDAGAQSCDETGVWREGAGDGGCD
jgi:hypothetical protein